MRLQQQIKKELTTAMKEKNEVKKSALRVIMGEFARQDKKELSDDEVVKIIQKLVKAEKETLEKSGTLKQSGYLTILESYLPKTASDEEIRNWISENIDFSQLKNKMQAMGTIMAHFGATADGNRVRQLLQQM
jgi:uncharacterized protein YqeY